MDNYMEMKEQLEKNQENLEKANKKSLELDNKSKEVKEIISDLKPTLIKKDNYILKQEDKDKIEKYINQVDKTNDEYKNIQTLIKYKKIKRKYKLLLKIMRHYN